MRIATLLFLAASAAFSQTSELELHAPAVERASQQIRAKAIHAHMVFLADDLLEGRGTATRGHEIAALYVATQFQIAGLVPGASGTWLHQVPMRRSDLDEAASGIVLTRPNGQQNHLAAGRDFVFGAASGESADLEAPVVFAGYGIVAPELHYDDYAGIDASGKIVAYFSGAPSSFAAAAVARHEPATVKAAAAVAHGAVGVLRLWMPADERTSSWDVVVRSLHAPSFTWIEAGAPPEKSTPLRGAWLGPAASRALFDGSARSYDDLLAHPEPTTLAVRARIAKVIRSADVSSPNVVGLIEGSDPRLRHEYLVISAHADHLGIGEPVNGDAIYNGAIDNASGVAALIELARAVASMPVRPRRSILFLATTGEEPGLIGSDYFAHHPTVPRDAIVADLNIDGAPFWPFDQWVARGAEHSSAIARLVDAAASAAGIKVIPDPNPEQNAILGSDQYSFVKQGIPSLIVQARGAAGRALALAWLRNRYHAPSDDMTQPLDCEEAARYARGIFLLAWAIANDDERPRWNQGDALGEQFGNQTTKSTN
ncbi:MAG TPA: M28 family peptidase [Thermoanaerobaculia bacterium]|nr:M28 family peptidase [Thermoanaerobaculia bacterium]